MQAVILAAGMGKRLKELTRNSTKCMVKINGITMIERMLSILDKKKLNKIVIVAGYEREKLIDFIETLSLKTPIEFVINEDYDKTNNIYSLFRARDYLLLDDTILLESDLVFEESVVDSLLNHPYPSLALVAKYENWMDGTVVQLDEEDNIKCFLSKKEFCFEDIPSYYKTVNIYKFSKEFSVTHYVPFLEAYCKALGNNEYYEQVLKVIALLDKPDIKAIKLGSESWYEIDDIQDLNIAESIFASKENRLIKLQHRYGGYWRYPEMLDYCYLVNPFFPNQRFMNEIKANFERLLCNYPSGLDVNCLLAAKYFELHKENIIVGNGASELIKTLMELLPGKTGVILPTFEEYLNRKDFKDIVSYNSGKADFAYLADSIINFFRDKDISSLILINPDNPTGNYIEKEDLLRISEWAQTEKIHFIVDESFADFAETKASNTLLNQELLNRYPEMIVLKSISKSFGVPGLRLGIAASGDDALIEKIKKNVSIWNINSFAEFFLQIIEKYKSDYLMAMEKFFQIRTEYSQKLKEIKKLCVYPSQANFIMCKVLPPYHSLELAQILLNDYHILIKDLSGKEGFDGESYIRVAVKTQEENGVLVDALQAILKD